MTTTPYQLRALGDSAVKNLIINGNMDFWQRGISFPAIASGNYAADRFCFNKTGTMVYTLSQSTDVPTEAQSGFQSTYSLLATVTTAETSLAAGDYTLLNYRMEGYDYAALHSKKCRLQFWCKASVAGTYSIGLRNGASNRSYVTTYTINNAATWEKKTLDIPLDTTGTWAFDNTVGLYIFWSLGAGTTSSTSTLNTWQAGSLFSASTNTNLSATLGATFQLAQVAIYAGNFDSGLAIPFQRAGRSIGHELQMCQRYYEKSDSQSSTSLSTNIGVYIAAPTGLKIWIPFRTEKRANPTLQQYSYATNTAGVYRDVTAAVDRTGTMSSAIQQCGFSFDANGTTAGNNIAVGWTADSEL